MNLSGEPLFSVIKFYKDFSEADLKSSNKDCPLNVLIVQDELDFKPGIVKYKLGGSAGGHNGVQSVINQMGTAWFPRVRIGIGHPREQLPEGNSSGIDDVSSWVLSKANAEDRAKMDVVVKRVISSLKNNLIDLNNGASFVDAIAKSCK